MIIADSMRSNDALFFGEASRRRCLAYQVNGRFSDPVIGVLTEKGIRLSRYPCSRS